LIKDHGTKKEEATLRDFIAMLEGTEYQDIIGISEAARIVGVSADSIRGAADAGRLRHFKIKGGQRLFYRKDVEKFKQARDKKIAAAG
jgi:excisionase family DNA binding protein